MLIEYASVKDVLFYIREIGHAFGMALDRTTLERLYSKERQSVKNISEKLKLSESTINYWLKKFEVQKRSISEAIYILHNPKGDPFLVKEPKTIEEALLFGLGLGLYWGEGTKANRATVRLGNTDPDLIQVFIRFLVKMCGVEKERLRFGLQIFSDMPPRKALHFWKTKLEVPGSQFYKVTVTPARSIGTYRVKSQYGVLTVYYGNKKLRDIICQLIEDMRQMPR